jgi:hypothetical protein
MAGALTISTLNNDTGVLATQNGMTGIAKAWINYKGTATVSIRDSFNVSSVTVVTTGTYTVNFTTALPNANYTIAGFSTFGANAAPAGMLSAGSDFAPTTTSCPLKSGNSTSGGTQDSPYFCAVFFSS